MKVNQTQVKQMLLDGFELRLGHVFIGRVKYRIPAPYHYQVQSEDHRFLFSALYYPEEIESAVDKFCLIINQIEERKRGKSRGAKKADTSV